jgi:hypothetical protein
MKSAEPHSTEPTGAHNPLLRQNVTESSHGGVEQPRAVHVQRQTVLPGHVLDGRHILRRQRVAVLRPIAVLDQHQTAMRHVGVVLAHGVFDLAGIHPADGVRRQRARHHPAQRGHPARLPAEDVAVVAENGLVAAPGVGQHGGQIAHRAAADKQAGFFADARRGQRFQFVDGRVLAIDVVADTGAGHRLAHGRRRPTDGIRPEVDSIHRIDSLRQVDHLG